MRTGFPEGWRQGGVCPAASTGGCSGRVGPGSSGTGPFRPGFSDSEGSEGFPTDSWTAVRAAQGPFSSASGTLQRAGHTPAARFNPAPSGPPGAWGKIFGSDAMTLAAVDRLVHRSHVFELNVESYRRRAAIEARRAAAGAPADGKQKGRPESV